jgi:hypothetical protein
MNGMFGIDCAALSGLGMINVAILFPGRCPGLYYSHPSGGAILTLQAG